MSNQKPSGPKDTNDPRLHRRVRKFERHVVEEIEIADTADVEAARRRERLAQWRLAGAWVGLLTVLTAAGLYARTPWPSDETRMLGIAWEMWARGDLLLPTLNDQPQPLAPLFFWLIHLGWWLTGVNEWWPRLVPALGALASLIVVQRVARRLWPEERELARYAPLLLLGMFACALAVIAIVPDAWLMFAVLLAYWGLVLQWRVRDHRAWLLTALGLGLAAFVAGPMAWLYVLPVALLAPLWAYAPRPQWRHWYADVGKASALALAAFAAWLFTVGAREGWPTVVHYLAHAWNGMPLDVFDGAQPWWWYAWLVPLVFLPWSVLPLTWMRLWHVRREPLDGGFLLCLTWGVVPLALLWLLPLKQPQYLLPLLPAGALLASRLLLTRAWRDVFQEQSFAGMAVPLMVLGGVMMVLPRLPRVEGLPGFLWEQSPFIGVALIGVGIATAWVPMKDVGRRVFDMAAFCVLLVCALLGFAAQFNPMFPVAQVGGVLAKAQADGRPLAHVGEYRGEFHFAGRLRAPLAAIEPARVEDWAAAHPNGAIVTYTERWRPRVVVRSNVLLETPFREQQLRIFDAQQVLSVPAKSE
jgi:4-amino-4-deoxy-L-arabinose transferase-like glycosyltransferase